MVNYCCVAGCGRNNRQYKNLNYYSIPKDRKRQIEWLKAADREDLLERKGPLTYRICSRHFNLSAIKNRNLSPNAVPTLCLPGDQEALALEPTHHTGLLCDNCSEDIRGFRYKCVTCTDYDLCAKCEMRETHPQHFMLRISKPIKFKVVCNLIKRWHKFFKSQHVNVSDCESGNDEDPIKKQTDTDTSDDEPITKYITRKKKENSDALSDEVKDKIRREVMRALKSKKNTQNPENGISTTKHFPKKIFSNDIINYDLIRTKKKRAAQELKRRANKRVRGKSADESKVDNTQRKKLKDIAKTSRIDNEFCYKEELESNAKNNKGDNGFCYTEREVVSNAEKIRMDNDYIYTQVEELERKSKKNNELSYTQTEELARNDGNEVDIDFPFKTVNKQNTHIFEVPVVNSNNRDHELMPESEHVTTLPTVEIKLSDDLSQFVIEVTGTT